MHNNTEREMIEYTIIQINILWTIHIYQNTCKYHVPLST